MLLQWCSAATTGNRKRAQHLENSGHTLICEFSCIKQRKKKLFNTWIYNTVNLNHRMLSGVPFPVFSPPLHRQGGTQTVIPKERRLWIGTAVAPTTTNHSSFTPRTEETLCGVCKEPQSGSHGGRGRTAGHSKPRLTTALHVCIL